MLRLLLGSLLSLILLVSCGPKPIRRIVSRPGYSYMEIKPGEYYVLYKTENDRDKALAELQCGICFFSTPWGVVVVEVPLPPK